MYGWKDYSRFKYILRIPVDTVLVGVLFCNGYFESNQRSRLSRWSPVIYFKQICASECIEMNKKIVYTKHVICLYINFYSIEYIRQSHCIDEEKGGKPGAFRIINNLNIQQKITHTSNV